LVAADDDGVVAFCGVLGGAFAVFAKVDGCDVFFYEAEGGAVNCAPYLLCNKVEKNGRIDFFPQYVFEDNAFNYSRDASDKKNGSIWF
jgi:hypothetical protein